MLSPSPSTGVLMLPQDAVPTTSCTALDPIAFPESCTPATQLHALRRGTGEATAVHLLRFTPKHGSWLLCPSDATQAPHLLQNGCATLITPVDPLFVVLPHLHHHALENPKHAHLFQPLHTLLPSSIHAFLSSLPTHALENLCDVRRADGDTFYRLSSARALHWLRRKYEVLRERVKGIHAEQLVNQYLTGHWTGKLHAAVVERSKEMEGEETNEGDDLAQPFEGTAAANAIQLMLEDAQEAANAPAMGASGRTGPSGNTKKKTGKAPPKPSAAARKFWSRAASSKRKRG